VAPNFLLACMLWHDVQERWSALCAAGELPFPALQQAVDAVFEARIGDISGRGRLAADMREIWLMQPRFERRTSNSALALIGQPRFRAGYDFLRLRADSGEIRPELADWWEDFHLGDDDEREALLQDVRAAAPPRPRRVPAAPGTASSATPAAPAPGVEVVAEGAPRKRRRRRRRPAGGGSGSGSGGGSTEGQPPAAE
jgi:poly(A) polymerase